MSKRTKSKKASSRRVGSIYRKPGCSTWFMRFSQVVDGKRVRTAKTTGETDEAAALAVLDKTVRDLNLAPTDEEKKVAKRSGVTRSQLIADSLLKAAHDADRARELEQRRRQEAAEAIAREAAEAQARKAQEAADAAARDAEDRAIAIADAFPVFTASKKRPDSSAVTLSHYESEYTRFANWMRDHHRGVRKLKDVTPEIAEAFLDHIEANLSINSRNKYLIFLRMFWRVMRWNADAQLSIDPWDGIRTLTQTTDEVVHKEMTVEEIVRIGEEIRRGEPLPVVRGNIRNPVWGLIPDAYTVQGESIRDELRFLFAIGVYTGLRLGDCVTLDWSSVDLVRNFIKTMPRKTMRKYKREVIVPVHPTFRAVLDAVPRARRIGPVMPILARMYGNDPSSVSRRVQAVIRAAGIETTANGEHGTRARTLVGFHSLRHTFSSIMLNAGVSPALVDAMLCHMKGTMTMRYYHEHLDALVAAVAKLPSFAQFTADGRAPVAVLEAPAVAQVEADADATPKPSRGVLDALREALADATAADLKAAVKMLRDEIKRRGAA